MSLENKDAILAEIDLFEQNANYLPQKKDIDILKNVHAIWVVSGSGSYFKTLIDTPSDQTNKDNLWYHGTDQVRLTYAQNWLISYKKLLPKNPQPILIYNGIPEQIDVLLKASKNKNYKIPLKQIYIAKGEIIRTSDQIKNFSFPPKLDIKNGYLAVVTHASHLVRVLHFMAKHKKIFEGIAVIALPITAKDPQNQAKMNIPEIKGILDYIKTKEADVSLYPFKLIDKTQ